MKASSQQPKYVALLRTKMRFDMNEFLCVILLILGMHHVCEVKGVAESSVGNLTEVNGRRIRRVVHSTKEFAAALRDDDVHHILLQNSHFNLTDDLFPYRVGVVRGGDRVLTIEGGTLEDGDLVYIDGNKLTSRVYVTDGATLRQISFWADDCINPTLEKFPFTCFGEASGGGARLELRDSIMSDAECIRISSSVGIHAILGIIQNNEKNSIRHLNGREVHIRDTGWISYVPPTASWRFVNVTLSCTGNITHQIPPMPYSSVQYLSNFHIAAIMTALGAILGFFFLLLKSSRPSSPEHILALSKGYELLERLGQGRSGWVYRARQIDNQQSVAIKVMLIRMTDFNKLKTSVGSESSSSMLYLDEGSRALHLLRRAELSQKEDPSYDTINDINSPDISHFESLKEYDPSTTYAVQIHIVMNFANQGNLYEAVQTGRFHQDGKPRLMWILETLLDVAEGLCALHDTEVRFVHRDLSPNNILLTTEKNQRGFRALISDFGLSTIISLGNSHRTSEAKGTLIYMSPELIESDLVSAALDCYSFGVIIAFILSLGKAPYENWTQARIMNHKLTIKDENQVPVPQWLVSAACNDDSLESLLSLMKACTRFDRHQRATAPQIVDELKKMLRFGNVK